MSASEQSVKITEKERGMLSDVVSRFLREQRPTPRRELLLKYEEPEALNNLASRNLLVSVNSQAYLPTALSFYFAGDQKALSLVKQSVEIVLHALKALYKKADDDGRFFTREEIATEARQLGHVVGPDTVWLGLFFAESFGVLGGWQVGENQVERGAVRVSEQILNFRQIERVWEDRLQQQLQWLGQRDQQYPPPHLQLIEDDPDIFHARQEGPLVFISHSSKDAELALALIELLKAGLGLTADQIRCSSVDGYRLPVGVNTESKLREEVNAAKVVVGLITPVSLASYFVMFELGARWGAGLFLAPLLASVKPHQLSGPLSLLNALSASNEAQLHQLLQDISKQLPVPLQNVASYVRYIPPVKLLADNVKAAPLPTDRNQTSPPLELTIEPRFTKYTQPGFAEFQITAKLWNHGTSVIRDYHVDIQMPAKLLDGDTALHWHEIPERRTVTHRFFRFPSPDARVGPIFPDDQIAVGTLTFYADKARSRDPGLLNMQYIVTAYAGSERVSLAKSLRDIFEQAKVDEIFS